VHLICLCPTYGRPSLVANALALFLRQQLFPPHSTHLHIFDDAGQLLPASSHEGNLSWTVESQEKWIPLTEKYAPMLAQHSEHMGSPDSAFVVWDDDDVYLPWHLAAIAETLHDHKWSHPSKAWSTYGKKVGQAPKRKYLGARCYHGALAVRGDLMQELGGWPQTDRSCYDKMMLDACRRAAGPPGDPCNHADPSYVYRWQDTGRDHISARIRYDEQKKGRYPKPRLQEWDFDVDLQPQLDKSAQALLDRFAPDTLTAP